MQSKKDKVLLLQVRKEIDEEEYGSLEEPASQPRLSYTPLVRDFILMLCAVDMMMMIMMRI